LRIFLKKYREDKRYLKSFFSNKKQKQGYEQYVNQLNTLVRRKALLLEISNEEADLIDCLGELYQQRRTNWSYIYESFAWIGKIYEVYGYGNISKNLALIFCNKETNDKATKYKTSLLNTVNSLTSEISFFNVYMNYSQFQIMNERIPTIINKFGLISKNISKLFDWISFINSRNDCLSKGLNDYLEKVEEEQISVLQYTGVFLRQFYSKWLDEVYAEENVVADFQRDRFEKIIEDFQKNDKFQISYAKARIRESLSSQRPEINGFTSRGTEVHALLRESTKKRRILPIRKLFEKIPNLLMVLKPCLLMSPLSVSQFINPDLYEFDTIIFDEASQVCTENAIGAIYRGKQLIVVGDREQLPPTNFFNAAIGENDYDDETDDDGNEFEIDAYESVLDECASILNRMQLLSHYRSRDERLIAYSNIKIYKNLITFPTSMTGAEGMGVEFIHVPNGVYERSTTRNNVVEAKKVAEVVFAHFDKYPNRSLGVVAFSEAQQIAIDNEISILRKENQRYESFFNESRTESFFIKNLENVQGDERDTIILSVGYGKDRTGKLSMFFGPLNYEGGYRRLNVAITRAKLNIKIVSSILPSDIDLSRTQSRGVEMLRGYMDFAIRGFEAINRELTVPEILEFDSPFEEQVYDVLLKAGYEVDTQVGCSGYRLDLAVRHPNQKGKYAIAIECDGASYHSAKTARERDRLREELLKIRGWRLYRIWSTDWIRNRSSEIDRLLTAVKNSIKDDEKNEGLDNEKLTQTTLPLEKQVIKGRQEFEFVKYKQTDINSIRIDTSHYFTYGLEIIIAIIEIESPIHEDVLYRRFAPFLGRERTTQYVIDHIERLLPHCQQHYIKKGDYFWHSKMKIPIFRVPDKGQLPRAINYISPEEIAEGMKIIIGNSIGIEKEALFLQMCKILGFNRTGGKILGYLDKAFDFLETQRKIDIIGNSVSLK
jgi:very-short-patch-repair endonuclease